MKLILLVILNLTSLCMAFSKYEDLYNIPRSKYSFPLSSTETIDIKREVNNYKILLPFNEKIRNYSTLYIATHQVSTTQNKIAISFKSNNITFATIKGDFEKPEFYKITLPKINSQTIEISPSDNVYIYQVYLAR